jgi:hypothetical protein
MNQREQDKSLINQLQYQTILRVYDIASLCSFILK